MVAFVIQTPPSHVTARCHALSHITRCQPGLLPSYIQHPRNITDATSDAMVRQTPDTAFPSHQFTCMRYHWEHSLLDSDPLRLAISITIILGVPSSGASSSSKSDRIQNPSDASDMVAIIPMPTILPVWLRNTPDRPVWS